MKRIIAALMVLVSVMTLSGCKEVPSFMPSYWDGLTKRGAREYIQDALREKYGEEFIVKKTYLKGGTWDTSADLFADCSPKSDGDIVFAIQALAIGNERVMRDDYIQNVVRKHLKQTIDEVLSINYDTFASEVYVTPLTKWYDSGIRLASEATIKNFSETFTDNDENYTLAYIVLESGNSDFYKIQNALQDMCIEFYSLNVSIDCYYTDSDTIELCKKESGKSYGEIGMVDILRRGEYEKDDFVFFNDDRGLVFFPSNNH